MRMQESSSDLSMVTLRQTGFAGNDSRTARDDTDGTPAAAESVVSHDAVERVGVKPSAESEELSDGLTSCA